MSIEHATITDPDLHEAKGVATANAGDVSFADGAGSAAHRQIVVADVSDLDLAGADEGDVFTADGLGSGAMLPPVPPVGSVVQGIYNYDDAGTAITPIPLTLADTDYDLTNDTLGPQTLEFPLVGLTKMWDEITNEFVWTEGDVLGVADTVDIRFDIIATTTTTNVEIEVALILDVGGIDIRLPVIPTQNYPSAGTYPLSRWMGVFMGNTTILNGPAKVVAMSNKTGTTIEVNGWYLRPLHTVNGVA